LTPWGYRFVSRLFGGSGTKETVATEARLTATPAQIWQQLMFYEEVPGKPALLLRILVPYPIRAEGDKTRPGTTVRCVYRTGDLTKRIKTASPPHLLEFDVIQQRLGIEGCLVTRGGSYRISASGDSSSILLITEYEAYLRPRFFWRPLEADLIRQLHMHILSGIATAAGADKPWRAAEASQTTPTAPSGTLA
jgi:hypothetical protein